MESTALFLTAGECAKALGMESRQFGDLVRKGLLPRGIKRGKRHVWTKDDLAAMAWLEVHRRRLRASKIGRPEEK